MYNILEDKYALYFEKISCVLFRGVLKCKL